MNSACDVLLHDLTHRVRLFLLPQIMTLCAWSDRQAKDRIRTLVQRGLLTCQKVWSAPLLALREPLACWSPGDVKPDIHSISYRARVRWKCPTRLTTVYVATPKAAQIVGGRGGDLKNPLQATHDLHVGQILLFLRRSEPEQARCWISEDLLEKIRGRRPDAAIVGDKGDISKAIEFAGAYLPARVSSCHDHFAAKNWRYEIW